MLSFIPSEVFVQPEPAKITEKLNTRPWCYILFCTSTEKQEIPTELFHYNGFADGQTITVKHGLAEWKLQITDNYFERQWKAFCTDSYIDRNDMLFLRNAGNFVYDLLSFSTNHRLIWTLWTVPLPIVADQPFISQGISLSITLIMYALLLHLLRFAFVFVTEITASRHSSDLIASSINPLFTHDIMALDTFDKLFTLSCKHTLEIPQHTHPRIHQSTTPAILLASGTRSYTIGMTRNAFHLNWDKFVVDHDLQEGQVLVFIPQSHASFAVLIFGSNRSEVFYPWHHTFPI